VPAGITFATKPELGRAMLERALDAGVPCAWVAGDSVYGADRALRRRIEARGGLGYVLAVTSGQRLGARRVDDWAAGVPVGDWQRLSAGEGAKGPRLYDWAFLPYRGGAPPGWGKGLLVRRKLDEPDELTFYLTLAPEGTDLATLVRVAGTRWTIESCFEAAKGEVGLDEYEVRSWTGWHRHVTLAMLAHAYLAAEPLPLTVPEVRRLVWRLVWARAPDPDAVLDWSRWRRRHQQRARRCHWQRRTGSREPRL
jgi:SRSO17 transposase